MKISAYILSFVIGFYGSALIIDKDLDVLKIKSIISLVLIFIATIFLMNDIIKRHNNGRT